MSTPTQVEAPPTPPTRKHPFLYYENEEGDADDEFLKVQVARISFRVHKWPLRRHCKYFRDLWASSKAPRSVEFNGDAMGLSADGWEAALKVLYTEHRVKREPTGIAQWSSVLNASQLWQSQFLRETAIEHLEKLPLTPLERSKLAFDNAITSWLPIVYRDICIQRAVPSWSVLRNINPSHLAGLLGARETFRNEVLQLRSTPEVHRQSSRLYHQDDNEEVALALISALQDDGSGDGSGMPDDIPSCVAALTPAGECPECYKWWSQRGEPLRERAMGLINDRIFVRVRSFAGDP